MSNPFYTYNSPVVAGTTIRADKYNSDLQALETAFDLTDQKFNRSVLLPSTFTGNPEIPEVSVSDSFLYINMQGDIDLYPLVSLNVKFDMVEAMYGQIDIWQTEVSNNLAETITQKSIAEGFANASEASADLSQAQVSLAEGYADDAANRVTEAEGFKDLAKEYADKPQNINVSGTSDYSALHYSLIAKFWADSAEATVNGDLSSYVLKTTKVAGKPLQGDIVLDADDVGALSRQTGYYSGLTGDVTLDYDSVGSDAVIQLRQTAGGRLVIDTESFSEGCVLTIISNEPTSELKVRLTATSGGSAYLPDGELVPEGTDITLTVSGTLRFLKYSGASNFWAVSKG